MFSQLKLINLLKKQGNTKKIVYKLFYIINFKFHIINYSISLVFLRNCRFLINFIKEKNRVFLAKLKTFYN